MAADELDRETARDRFQGCLMGVAVGDALGAPVEHLTHYDIRKRYGVLRDMVGGGWLHLEPGQWTDDTAQTLALAECYLDRRELDLDDFARRLVAWFDSNPPDVGEQTKAVLEYLKEYPSRTIIAARKFWYSSGGTLAGNGSLMRCAPTAMFRWRALDAMVRETILASQVTHFDPRCCEACLVSNFVIAQCLHGSFRPDSIDPASLFCRSLHRMPVYHNLVANYEASKLSAPELFSINIPYLEAMDAIEGAVRGAATMDRADLKSTGYVVDTLQSALYLLSHSTSFAEGLIEAVNLGGDADTLGAVVGAMLGARFGYSQIPPEWADRVASSSRILETAEALFAVAPAPQSNSSAPDAGLS